MTTLTAFCNFCVRDWDSLAPDVQNQVNELLKNGETAGNAKAWDLLWNSLRGLAVAERTAAANNAIAGLVNSLAESHKAISAVHEGSIAAAHSAFTGASHCTRCVQVGF